MDYLQEILNSQFFIPVFLKGFPLVKFATKHLIWDHKTEIAGFLRNLKKGFHVN